MDAWSLGGGILLLQTLFPINYIFTATDHSPTFYLYPVLTCSLKKNVTPTLLIMHGYFFLSLYLLFLFCLYDFYLDSQSPQLWNHLLPYPILLTPDQHSPPVIPGDAWADQMLYLPPSLHNLFPFSDMYKFLFFISTNILELEFKSFHNLEF